jgi:hypothetical protein
LERFFQEIIKLISIDREIIQLIRDNYPSDFSNLYYVRKHNRAIIKDFPKLTHVNSLMSNKDIQSIIWTKLRLDANIKFPRGLPNELLYGSISEMIHLPKRKDVYLSNNIPNEQLTFFLMIIKRYQLLAQQYSEEAAAAAQVDLLSEQCSNEITL